MNGKPLFHIAQLVAGPIGEDLSRPWFVCETVLTSDGPRTRICNGRWKTREEAHAALKDKELEAGYK